MDQVLGYMGGMAGVNSVYLVALMHKEHRPFRADKLPHNPARDTLMAEDAAVYWQPEMGLYGKLKPALSTRTWLNGKNIA